MVRAAGIAGIIEYLKRKEEVLETTEEKEIREVLMELEKTPFDPLLALRYWKKDGSD